MKPFFKVVTIAVLFGSVAYGFRRLVTRRREQSRRAYQEFTRKAREHRALQLLRHTGGTHRLESGVSMGGGRQYFLGDSSYRAHESLQQGERYVEMNFLLMSAAAPAASVPHSRPTSIHYDYNFSWGTSRRQMIQCEMADIHRFTRYFKEALPTDETEWWTLVRHASRLQQLMEMEGAHGLKGSSLHTPWVLNDNGELVLEVRATASASSTANQNRIRGPPSILRKNVFGARPAAGTSKATRGRGVISVIPPVRPHTVTPIPGVATLERARAQAQAQVARAELQRRREAHDAARAELQRERETQAKAEAWAKLYLTDVCPPDLTPPKPHHQCGICWGTKSHPVTNGCGHSYCYVCTRTWLDTNHWTCPDCAKVLHAHPIRVWAEEQGLLADLVSRPGAYQSWPSAEAQWSKRSSATQQGYTPSEWSVLEAVWHAGCDRGDHPAPAEGAVSTMTPHRPAFSRPPPSLRTKFVPVVPASPSPSADRHSKSHKTGPIMIESRSPSPVRSSKSVSPLPLSLPITAPLPTIAPAGRMAFAVWSRAGGRVFDEYGAARDHYHQLQHAGLHPVLDISSSLTTAVSLIEREVFSAALAERRLEDATFLSEEARRAQWVVEELAAHNSQAVSLASLSDTVSSLSASV
ncbi:hypothetical protein C8R43DRAFT_1121187 [Mycena crocata]|nr:hypothetical protein C8R43DRAFT_1121187 [Mycena crocata]